MSFVYICITTTLYSPNCSLNWIIWNHVCFQMWDYLFVCYWLKQIWQESLKLKSWPLRILSDSLKRGLFVEFCQAAILNNLIILCFVDLKSAYYCVPQWAILGKWWSIVLTSIASVLSEQYIVLYYQHWDPFPVQFGLLHLCPSSAVLYIVSFSHRLY